ncbi:hypothetical protein PC110_g20641 [Phytophthora cactorum]|uniref:Crinkler effector protein N-terminal domain-containing protein n=1 Tax=Phytophthora cactorum TaxID=29920 RepID=A0A329RGQ1_9STRA|nr:hypothetical protein PC110_g20641 [Phytophthora cactorum]
MALAAEPTMVPLLASRLRGSGSWPIVGHGSSGDVDLFVAALPVKEMYDLHVGVTCRCKAESVHNYLWMLRWLDLSMELSQIGRPHIRARMKAFNSCLLTSRHLNEHIESVNLPTRGKVVLLNCALVGDGSVISIIIEEWKTVALLKKAIKEEKPSKIQCDADELQLFLAKKGGEWLDGATAAAVVLDDRGHPQGFEKMDPLLWIKNAKYFVMEGMDLGHEACMRRREGRRRRWDRSEHT